MTRLYVRGPLFDRWAARIEPQSNAGLVRTECVTYHRKRGGGRQCRACNRANVARAALREALDPS